MEQIGYSGVDLKKLEEVWFAGDTYRICPAFPTFINIPERLQIFNAVYGETYNGIKFVSRYIQDGPVESIKVYEDKVVVTRPLGE